MRLIFTVSIDESTGQRKRNNPLNRTESGDEHETVNAKKTGKAIQRGISECTRYPSAAELLTVYLIHHPRAFHSQKRSLQMEILIRSIAHPGSLLHFGPRDEKTT